MTFVAELHRFGHVSSICTSSDIDRCCKLAEVCKEFLKTNLTKIVRQRSQQPLLLAFGSDCTPLTTQEQVKASWQHFEVRRRGRSCHEYLIQRIFAQDVSGNCAAYFVDPLVMGDKGAWAHWQAQRDFFPLGRELGHQFILISHHCWDRAIFSACDRHQRQLHEAMRQHHSSTKDAGEAHLEWLCSWYTGVSCILQDIQNSLKWSILI